MIRVTLFSEPWPVITDENGFFALEISRENLTERSYQRIAKVIKLLHGMPSKVKNLQYEDGGIIVY